MSEAILYAAVALFLLAVVIHDMREHGLYMLPRIVFNSIMIVVALLIAAHEAGMIDVCPYLGCS